MIAYHLTDGVVLLVLFWSLTFKSRFSGLPQISGIPESARSPERKQSSV